MAALILAGSAAAGEARSPELTNAASMAAGRTTDVSCEPDVNAWDAETRRVLGLPGTVAQGYTLLATRQVRLAPWVCFSLAPSSSAFGAALYVVAIEAARVAGHGIGAEGIAGCFALQWAAELAWRVWDVPAVYVPGGTGRRAAAEYARAPLLKTVAQARAQHARMQPQYRTLCG